MIPGPLHTDERNVFMPALAGFFALGIWLAPRVEAGLWPLWIGVCALLAVVPLRLLRLPLRLICLPLALLCALLWTQHWLSPPMPPPGRVDTITATVYGDSKVSASGNVTFVATDVTLNGVLQPGKAYVTAYSSPGQTPLTVTDGMRIRFSGKVYRADGKQNEYDFDFRTWMLERGLYFGISGVNDLEILPGEIEPANIAQRIAAVCHQKLQTVMGEQADLAVAMLLGQRGMLAQEDTEAFRQAGVAHVMAVSGLHVGILSGVLLWLLERFRLRRKTQIPVVAVFLLLYCGMTGFAVSSLRAGAMVLLFVAGGAAGRRTNPMTVTSAALLAVLILNPLQLFSAGFVLSFSAVAGIFVFYPRLMQGLDRLFPAAERQKKRKRAFQPSLFLQKCKQAVGVSLAAQLGVALPIAAYYHAVYPYSLPFNLVIVPLVGVLVPLYALTLIVLFIPWAGAVLAVPLGFAAKLGTELVLRLVRVSVTLPLAELRVPTPSAWVCIAGVIAAVAVSHFIRAPLRRRLLAIAAVAVIAITGSYAMRPPSLRYHQFAAGSADAALIVDGGATIGIDTGNNGGEMLGRLLAEGRNLDALILTHLHSDHAGGVGAILDAGVRVGRVYLPADVLRQDNDEEGLRVLDRLAAEGIPVTALAAGDTLRFHETTIEALWPQAGRTRMGIDPNDRSLAMLITLGGVRILSMADNGVLYERYAAVPADVLKAGHHGSKTSSGEAFLQAVGPTLALITVRADSNVPASSTLERLAAYNVQVLRTDETGEITIVPVPNGYRAYRYLPEGTR